VLLGRAFADIIGTRYGIQTTEAGSTASTDFVSAHTNQLTDILIPTQGNVSYGENNPRLLLHTSSQSSHPPL
jgi:hypothetical protein